MRWLVVIGLLFPALLLAQPAGPDTLWTRFFGSEIPVEAPQCLFRTGDGSVAMAGHYYAAPDSPAVGMVRKIDVQGNGIWFRTYPTQIVFRDGAATSDSGLVVVGDARTATLHQATVVRLSREGDTVWTRVSDGTYHAARAVEIDAEGNIWVAGTAGPDPAVPDPTTEYTLLRLSAAGDTLWHRQYPRSQFHVAEVEDLVLLPDGGCLIGGDIYRLLGSPERARSYVIRTDSGGDTLWTRDYYSAAGASWVNAIALCPDGGFFLAGGSNTAAEGERARLLRIDAQGGVLWDRIDPATWEIRCVLARGDGDCITYARHSDFMTPGAAIQRVSRTGVTLWQTTLHRDMTDTGPTDLLFEQDGLLAGAGCSRIGPIIEHGALLVRLDADHTAAVLPPAGAPAPFPLAISPNPFNSTAIVRFSLPRAAHVSLMVYDLVGREVAVLVDEVRGAGEQRVRFDASRLASGIYFCRLEAGGRQEVRKVMLLR